MAGLLSRLKAVFNSVPAAHHAGNDTIEITQPSNFSMASISASFYRSLFGKAEQVDSLSVPQKLILDVVTQDMSQQTRRLKAVPRLPSVIPKLLQSLRNKNSSSKDYVNIINKDPVMTAAVLKLANSVYFNPIIKRITSIEIAVVKLGIDGLRTVLSAAVMQPVIERKSPYFANFGHKLWQHSLSCAVACEIIARQRGLEPYKAYLLGLVHDMGKITLFCELCTQFKINSHQMDKVLPSYATFAPLMETLSPMLSYSIAKDWELPEEICSALHQQVDLSPGDKVGAYAHLLFQANLACEMHFTLKEAPEEDRDILERASQKALSEMALPKNLFKQLDSIEQQITA
ncbi:HDOD domain-containing protein [Dasania marina]|uniref:HDOD domain-containing protein n=1 Tax=Dasania marina TaxID=471499 RepID=UPI00036257D9|nr:HDOD domain-containing protein [Dasania marina]